MENTITQRRTKVFNDFGLSRSIETLTLPEPSRVNPVMEIIRKEGGEDFFQYLQWLQLAREPNLLAISSTHHFYYESDEMKTVRTLVTLKKLNNIQHLNHFLLTVVRILPQKANFIGYFKNDTGNQSVFSFYQSTRLLNGLVNYLDSKTDRSLTKKTVSGLLEEQKLNVIDITDINGMTYFFARKTG